MKEYKIQINQETINYLERLHYDVNMRQNIIQTLITNKATDDSVLTSKPFLTYSEELGRLSAEYELAKKEVELYYLPEDLRDKHEYSWSIDFKTNEMLLQIMCDCGVEIYERESK